MDPAGLFLLPVNQEFLPVSFQIYLVEAKVVMFRIDFSLHVKATCCMPSSHVFTEKNPKTVQPGLTYSYCWHDANIQQ